jgi:outer membrane immunogenic protein
MRILVLAAAGLVTAPVLAQASPDVFNGPYAGIQAGWQQDRQTLEIQAGGFTTRGSETGSGLLYGGQIGYDFRLASPLVFGIEASLIGRTGSRILDDGVNSFRLSQGRTIGTSARLGVLVGRDSLFYGRLGYANAQFRLRDGNFMATENRDGYTLGVGYEQAISRNVSARVEYGYSNFGRDRLPALAPGSELQYRRHALATGVNFRF